jgi:hypothetical protein
VVVRLNGWCDALGVGSFGGGAKEFARLNDEMTLPFPLLVDGIRAGDAGGGGNPAPCSIDGL